MLVLGCFAAHRGYLELTWVLVSAFLGTLLNGQILFYIGRVKGENILEKRPNLKSKIEKALVLLNSHQSLLILGFRFLYGLRTVTPFLLGASRVSPFRFLILNILGAFIWTIVIGIMGYLFGHALELIIGDIKRYEGWIFFGIAVSGIIVWCIRYLSKRNI